MKDSSPARIEASYIIESTVPFFKFQRQPTDEDRGEGEGAEAT
jgi:hypothetical protein